MTPPAALLDHFNSEDVLDRPLAKKRRVDVPSDHEDSFSPAVRKHPLGVRPLGNAFTSKVNLKASCGLFALLPDELLAQFLEQLNAADLLLVGATCRALHAFTRSEELWRALFVE